MGYSYSANHVGNTPSGAKRQPFPESFVSFWHEAMTTFASHLGPEDIDREIRNYISNKKHSLRRKRKRILKRELISTKPDRKPLVPEEALNAPSASGTGAEVGDFFTLIYR